MSFLRSRQSRHPENIQHYAMETGIGCVGEYTKILRYLIRIVGSHLDDRGWIKRMKSVGMISRE